MILSLTFLNRFLMVFGPLWAPCWFHFVMIFEMFFDFDCWTIKNSFFDDNNVCFLTICWHRFLNIFVCIGPSKRKGWHSTKPNISSVFSYIFKIWGFDIFKEIHTSRVRFSSRRRRPFRHRFFVVFSTILDRFSDDLLMFFRWFV